MADHRRVAMAFAEGRLVAADHRLVTMKQKGIDYLSKFATLSHYHCFRSSKRYSIMSVFAAVVSLHRGVPGWDAVAFICFGAVYLVGARILVFLDGTLPACAWTLLSMLVSNVVLVGLHCDILRAVILDGLLPLCCGDPCWIAACFAAIAPAPKHPA